MTFERDIITDFLQASSLEWLETNGVGGWASSTVSGAHTRRYHGILVAALRPPVNRMVLLSRLDEAIEVHGERYELGTRQFPGAIHPHGYQLLTRFSREEFPVFEFRCGNIEVQKTVGAIQGENTTIILYQFGGTFERAKFVLEPFVAARDYHNLTYANEGIKRTANFSEGVLRLEPYHSLPAFFIQVPGATFEPNPAWHYRFEYAREEERGLPFQEDLFSYGVLAIPVQPGMTVGVIVSTHDPKGREVSVLLEQERKRRRQLRQTLVVDDPITAKLVLASDQFIVRRGNDLRTIIAGYHWFTDWGRDTMIALPGVCLVTGRFDEAKQILRAFAKLTDQGMLPNCFPDHASTPEYNTVDATLWFFVAAYKYMQYTRDVTLLREELFPVLSEICSWYIKGTRYGIRMESDFLITAGDPSTQLTWMDAKVGDWVVTPRHGKAVEINALWYNAVMIMAEFAAILGERRQVERFQERGAQVKKSFTELFWNAQLEYLYDVVRPDFRDESIRPNQLFALSLPFPLLEDKQLAASVLRVVERHLLTPVGLRSLSPIDRHYRGTYNGGQLSRDGAYHQGTVWSWLLGPMISAIVRYQGDSGRKRARQMIEEFLPHLEEAGIGTVSEIFDGDVPHAPRGCIAQAWGIGEILRAYVEDVCGSGDRGE